MHSQNGTAAQAIVNGMICDKVDLGVGGLKLFIKEDTETTWSNAASAYRKFVN